MNIFCSQLYKEEKESAPMFTFHLRPRVMQEGSTCKLLCCLTGNPHPAITWTKVTFIADYFPIIYFFNIHGVH